MNTTTETPAQEGNFEVLPPSQVAALERASIDMQVSTAHAYPRSLEQFKKRALSMATLDVETAESCLYKRPVGKGDDGKQKIAEGASIRMAEIVAASYGNIRVAAGIVEQTERYVKTQGIAHDLEANYAAKSECMEPTVKRNGQPYSEGQRAVVAKAALSKAFRDAVFKVVPKALCKTVIDAARRVAVGDAKTLESRRSKLAEWVKSLKIDEKRVFAVIGVQGWSDIGLDHIETLIGLHTAMKDGDTTIDEAFPPLTAKPNMAPKSGLLDPVSQTSAPPEPTTPPPQPQPTAPAETPRQEFARVVFDEYKVPFDDFRDFLQTKGIIKDASTLGGFDEVTDEVLAKLTTKSRADILRLYGTKPTTTP